MLFSGRTPDDLSHNPIAKALEEAQGQPLIDLTESNPTRCGFDYPETLLKGLSQPDSLLYEPESFGNLKARKLICTYLAHKGQKVLPENLVLTASTSEAYSYLFKLLGNPGDLFMVPIPGYPLLDHLVHLEAVELLPYHLEETTGWPVHLESLETPNTKTKGLIVVNPHNPTGCFLSAKDQKTLTDFCQKHSMAYISDEVFADYSYNPEYLSIPVSSDVLSFRMGGLSKSLGLPQLKLSWMVLEGPTKLLAECRERLELIADTYLSVNTPVQVALEDLLRFAPSFQKQLLSRIIANRTLLESQLKDQSQVKLWPAQGGWYALVEVLTEGAHDELIVMELLEKHKVLVQPGGFYDFAEGCFLVLSLLPKPEVFEEGARRLSQYLSRLGV